MLWLKQSTSTTRRFGPFLDEDNGKDAETGLTINQADIRLSKAGGNFAQSADSGGAIHDENGWYYLTLDGTDTNTVGSLEVAIHVSGALPVWKEFMVVPANVYDSLFAGTDYLLVDTYQVEGSDATNQIRDAVLSDATRLGGANLNTLAGNDPGSQLAAQTDITALNDLSAAQVLTALTDDDTRLDGSAINALAGNDPGSQLAAQSDITALNDLSAAQVLTALTDDDTRLDGSAINTLAGHDPGSQLAAQTDITALNDLSAAQVLTALTDDDTRLDGSAINALAGNDPGSQLAAQSDITALNDLSAAQVLTALTDDDTKLDGSALNALAGHDPGSQLASQTDVDEVKGTGFTGTSSSLQAIRTRGDAAWITGAGGDATEAKQDTIIAELAIMEGAGFTGTVSSLAAIRARGDAAWVTGGTGSGAITFVYTLTSSVDGTPIADANVWVTQDIAGSTVLASGVTDQNGQVTFYLDAGTVYVWRQKSGWNFDNPDTGVVA
jgi:hypothetical protein